MTAGVRNRTKTITAQNTFSDPISMKNGGILTLSGTFVATISLQRFDTGSNAYVDVTNNSGAATTFTLPGTYTISPAAIAGIFRFGVKTGNFTSGTIVGCIEGQ